jgi:nicotinate-nucleotide--dimethylbenzimidazole phosphoribosyltransferase
MRSSVTSGTEELVRLLGDLPGPDRAARAAVAARARRTLRPAGSLSRLDEVATWLAGWQRTDRPAVRRPRAVLFAGDHGVTARGVTAYPSSVTASVVKAVEAGAATAPALARQAGVEVTVVDVSVGFPTGDLAVEAALDPERFAECVEVGRRSVAGLAVDLLVLGEMGIGNTTAAAAVSAALFGGPAADWVGPGAGLDAGGMARKTAVVRAARRRIAGAGPLDVLRELGGAELAALAGAALEARRRSVPVLLDGYVVTAAVAPLALVAADALDHCLAAHRSPEPGHARLLTRLGLRPLLDLDMRLGEGSGGLLAVPLIRMASAAVTDVTTFDEWGLEVQ